MSDVQRDLDLSQQCQGRLESDVHQLRGERADLSDQLAAMIRDKNQAAEAMLPLRRDMQRYAAMVDQLNADKQALMSDKAQLSDRLVTAQQDIQQLNDVRWRHDYNVHNTTDSNDCGLGPTCCYICWLCECCHLVSYFEFILSGTGGWMDKQTPDLRFKISNRCSYNNYNHFMTHCLGLPG